jgi:MFS family permease
MSISQSLFISPAVGYTNDHFGPRTSLLLGTVFVSLSMFTASYSTRIWHLFLSQGVCFGWGLGFLYITAAPMLGLWFSSKRSLAVGIASSGAGFGGLAFNLAAGAGVETLGVRWTYRLLALCTLAVNLVCSLLLRHPRKYVPARKTTFDLREFGHVSVVLIIFWGWFTELGYIVLLYSLPTYARSIGLSAHQGAVVGAVLNLGLAFGRPIIGWLSDRLGRIDVATGTFRSS